MPPKVATSESGTTTLGMSVAADAAQEHEDHQHHQQHAEHERELHVADRGADGLAAVHRHLDVDGRRDGLGELREQRLHPLDDVDDVGARLAADDHDHRRSAVDPARDAVVLDPVLDVGDVAEPDRRAVPVGDDDGPEGGGWNS